MVDHTLAAGEPGGGAAEPDTASLDRLVQFVEAQDKYSWAQITDIVQEAGLGDMFTLRLCEHLLQRRASAKAAVPAASEWQLEKGLLVKYIQVHDDVRCQQTLPGMH